MTATLGQAGLEGFNSLARFLLFCQQQTAPLDIENMTFDICIVTITKAMQNGFEINEGIGCCAAALRT
ncbi:MAG: hypothetical protein CTY19_07110 [Methylomonas sp.]|nr:MAG: hypothetical protein CTY19_07110 [Methylomonas sp.]